MSETQAVLEADARRRAAIISGDVEVLTALLSDRMIWTHSSGKVDDKASFLEGLASGSVKYIRLDVEDVTVLQQLDVFILHGTLLGLASRAGVEKSLRNRFLSVWQQHKDGFQMLAWQSTGF